MSEAPRHPRHAERLQQLDAPARSFLDAHGSGRVHHAWLFTGAQGLGKASLAYRAAQRLLGAEPSGDAEPLGSRAGDAAVRMVAAQTHPDLLVLERAVEGQPARKSIPVDEARRLPEFFAKSPAIAACRVAIVDAADDLNVNAANAVLKTLEEPSGRGVLILVSHAPGRLLPTIRSRCRRLAFQPWPEALLSAYAEERLGLEREAAARLATLAAGSPGRLAQLAQAGGGELDGALDVLFAPETPATRSEALRLADGFRGAEGMARFTLLFQRLAERLRGEALQARSGLQADRLARLQQRASELPGRVEGLNLDRADAFWSFLADMRAAGAGVRAA